MVRYEDTDCILRSVEANFMVNVNVMVIVMERVRFMVRVRVIFMV